MTPIKKEIRQSGILLVGTAASVLLGLAYTIYALRVLGPEASSAYTLALSFVGFCQIALGPINGTAARFTAKFAVAGALGKVRSLARALVTRTLIATCVLLLPAGLFVSTISGFWNLDSPGPLIVAYAAVVLTLLLSIARGVLRGVEAFASLSANTVAEAALRLFVGIAILYFVPTATGALCALLPALVGVLILSWFQVNRRLGHGEAEPFDGGQVLRFAGPLLVMMIASAGFQNLDMLAVKHGFGAHEAGLYGAAFSIARLIGAVVTPFAILLLPTLTRAHARGESVTGPLLRIIGYFLALAALALVVFAMFAKGIVTTLLGSEFAGGAPVLLAIAALRVVGFLCHLIALAGAAQGRFTGNFVLIPSLIVQAVWVLSAHERTADVVSAMLWCQSVTLLIMIGLAARPSRGRGQHTASREEVSKSPLKRANPKKPGWDL